MRLADHIVKGAWPVFSGGNLVVHNWCSSFTWQDVE
jgi:hypothetical protein